MELRQPLRPCPGSARGPGSGLHNKALATCRGEMPPPPPPPPPSIRRGLWGGAARLGVGPGRGQQQQQQQQHDGRPRRLGRALLELGAGGGAGASCCSVVRTRLALMRSRWMRAARCSSSKGKRVWAYAQGKLRHGYPRLIAEEFPGVPGDLAAAVECHPEECTTETIIFFQGPAVLSYDLKTKDLKRRQWPAVANCSAAVRWLERYYCFQGIRFWRFDPATGDVPPHYPLDARDYFMLCPGRGHGHGARGNATLRAVTDRCSGHPFQAFSSDDSGRIYAFRGGQYFRLDSARDGWHSWPLNHTWKELEGKVDAAFSWEEKLHLIQGSQVTIYRAAPGYPRVEGYPRALQAELGLAGADAAFTCPHAQELYVIQGSQMRRVDLLQSPRAPGPAVPLPHAQVDGALCTSKGVYLFHGADFHHYADVAALSAALAPAPAQSTAAIFFRCPAVAAGSGQQGSPQQRPPRQR
ncbi:hemopexin isoform X2 [Hemicordylus capensis]|uniref:hemopexin isoform X2 n=1 Tax=Hemicordylus capensis TaxID=884348 RepID=UPI002304AD35|nr:hemopexin isoform X2 [Hemicordylus capensis]